MSVRDAYKSKKGADFVPGGARAKGDFNVFKYPDTVKFFPPREKTEDGTRYFTGAIKVSLLPFIITEKGHPGVIARVNDIGDVANFFRYSVHKSIGQKAVGIMCPSIVGEPCPICNHQSELYMGKRAEDKPFANTLWAKNRVIMFIRVESGEYKDQVFLFDTWDDPKGRAKFPSFLKQIEAAEAKYMMENDLNSVDYADPDNGLSLSMMIEKKTETFGKNTVTYADVHTVSLVARKSPVKDSELEQTFDPSKYMIIKPADYIERVLFTQDDAESEEEEEESEEDKTFEDDDIDDVIDKHIAEPAKEPDKPKCPNGFRFGKDFSKSDECEDCKGDYIGCMKASKNN